MYQETQQAATHEQLREVQAQRLKDLVSRVWENNPIYRSMIEGVGVTPADITSAQDIVKLPFTVKDDLRSAYPYKLFTAPLKDIVRVHSSSGTTGQISVVGYTKDDLQMWADCVRRALDAAGATEEDIVQIAYGYGLFTGGLGLHYGVEDLGAIAIPVSGGNTKRQIQVLSDFGVTGIAVTPSYALALAEQAREAGVDLRALPIRFGIFGAEPWSEQMRAQLEEAFGIEAFDIYGLSEILGPGVGFECKEHNGLHINEDHFLVEILDKDTLEPVEDGEYGEVVFTTLSKQGIPLLRYRTRDISRIIPGECGCGRTFRRLERITGRSDDMLIIRGVNVYPSQIEQVLLGIQGVAPHYQLILTKKGALDSVEVRVEMASDFAFDEIGAIESVAKSVRDQISSALAISLTVKLVEPKSLVRSEGKAVRVIDLRSEGE